MAKLIIYLFVISCLIQKSIHAQDYADKDYIALYEQDNQYYCDKIRDPFEAFNRKVFNFNMALDKMFLRPISSIYGKVTPPKLRTAVTNIFNNLYLTNVFVNSLLQGKIKNSLVTFWRFAINSTVGIGGAFDVAGKIGLTPTQENLGNTLAYYGMAPGPYLVLPFFGPTTLRDVSQNIISSYELFNPPYRNLPASYFYGLKTLDIINKRKNTDEILTSITLNSTDLYSELKSLYWQKRENDVKYPKYSKCYKKRN
jgi:phospholipid-binding lipoprotein MlaA